MTTPTPDDEHVKAQVSKELKDAKKDAKTLAETLNFEEVKSGKWFIKLLQQVVRAYDRNARATYFQNKYPGLPPDEIDPMRPKVNPTRSAANGWGRTRSPMMEA